jgi:hypothetical protein
VGLRLALAVVLALMIAAPAGAAPRKTRFDGIRDCERLAAIQLKRHNAGFRQFTIHRGRVTVDRFAGNVGSSFVSAVYHGTATYDVGKGPGPTRFICLHGGLGNHALFVYTLPET